MFGTSPARRPLAAALVVLSLAAAGPPPPARAADGPPGVLPGARAGFLETQARLLATPKPDGARRLLRTLTEEPHIAGTPAGRRTAEFVRDKLRGWGWDADLVEYHVLLNYPKPGTVNLALVAPTAQKLKVIEDAHVPDKDSVDPELTPAFHGYGPSGQVEGQVVYANYGRPEDFEALERLGVDVKGKVVLVRYYGNIFRGLKVLNAQKRGAAGVLIYSDPADDGYAKGDVYPNGPYRPASAIQRGSVQFLSKGPGDPTTPGTPSLPNAPRLPWDPRHGFPLGDTGGLQAVTAPDGTLVNVQYPSRADWERQTGLKRDEAFAAIPSLPISYEAAQPILASIGGPAAPGGWSGGLPLTYHVGPGPARVNFGIQMDYAIRPIWNVVAKIQGSTEPDRWVLIGNHRDAWTYGAVDPSSGTAATMEAARALGEAVKAGWKPKRTLVYCSWDAEEYGLVGSTEWAEHHAAELKEKAVMMLNVDSAVSGPDLDLDGTPSLRDLMLDAASAVIDPRTGQDLKSGWVAKRRAAWADEPIDLDRSVWSAATKATTPTPEAFSPRMHALGSGSDYTAFVDHLGIPAVDANFVGPYGVYHASFDNFFWMEKFGDPEFLRHATAAKFYAAVALRAASADVIPFTFTPYAEALRSHVDDLRRTVAKGARAVTPPKVTAEGLAPLVPAVRAFAEAAAKLDAALAKVAAVETPPAGFADRLSALNDQLLRVERAFLASEGLPGRAWYRHTIYAPGLTTGYAAWPLPGPYQAVTEDDPTMLAEQLRLVVRQLDQAAGALNAARRAAESALGGGGE
jgi:N-acetylated-alpha-linked acidic dipeptidase